MVNPEDWPKVVFYEDYKAEMDQWTSVTRELTSMILAWLVAKKLLKPEAFLPLCLAAFQVGQIILTKEGSNDNAREET